MAAEQTFTGTYLAVDGLRLFKLPAAELERLAALLEGTAARPEAVRIRVGAGVLHFSPSQTPGFAAASDADGIVVTTDPDALHELAALISQMTHDHNRDHFAHTHLEAFFTTPPQGGITDIVIERQGDPT